MTAPSTLQRRLAAAGDGLPEDLEAHRLAYRARLDALLGTFESWEEGARELGPEERRWFDEPGGEP